MNRWSLANFSALIFALGLAVLLFAVSVQLPLANAPMLVGNSIIAQGVADTGAANLVTAVVLAYRGLDTLGELSILFAAAGVVGLLLTGAKAAQSPLPAGGFVVSSAVHLLTPLLFVVGFYIIFHGHLTPGGGFQGGVILAMAFFLPYLVDYKPLQQEHQRLTLIESVAGGSFIVIGLFSLFSGQAFLQPFLGHGAFGNLWSAGTLPLLYIAVGLKVGSELSSLLINLLHAEDE